MEFWLAVISFLFGIALLYFSSEIAIDRLIQLATLLGASMFSIWFFISSIGSDLPEIFSGIVSAFLSHGNIAVGNSLGSVNTQISLILGLIPFFAIFVD
jgi:cation:H+ antiporter